MWLGFLVGWHPALCEQTLNDGSVSRHIADSARSPVPCS
jgi:hypothetical protein